MLRYGVLYRKWGSDMWTKCSNPPTLFTRVEIKDKLNNKYLGYYTGKKYLESEGHRLIKHPKYWRYIPKKQHTRINIQDYYTPHLTAINN